MSLLASSAVCFLLFCCYACYAWAWYDMVPFTVDVVKGVMQVVTGHPALLFIAILSVVLSTSFLMVCCFAGVGLIIEFEEMLKNDDSGALHYVVLFFWTLVTGW